MAKKTSTIHVEGHKFEIDLHEQSFFVKSEPCFIRVAHIKSMDSIKEVVESLVRQGMALKEQQIRNALGIR